VLRYSFLPSDFHPMLLILGDPHELRALGQALRQFAGSASSFAFSDLTVAAPSDTTVVVTHEQDAAKLGMHPISLGGKRFGWSLAPYTAHVFAEIIDEITAPEERSGSEMLLCSGQEIPVKISFGEFTDDFLISGQQHSTARLQLS